jgi:hypothetical protein
MQTNIQPLVDLVKLPDGDYFVADEDLERRLSDAMRSQAMVEGSAIGCPQVVDVDQHARLPFAWATWTSNLRAWSVVEARNSVVVVSDLSTGKLSAHDPRAAPGKADLRGVPKSREGTPQDIIAPKGSKGGCDVLNLREFAAIPWKPGRYAATLLIYDWVTNTVVIDLQSKGVGLAPEAAAALRIPYAEAVALDEKHKRVAENPYPMYRFGATPKTPALAGPGLALAVPAAITAKAPEWFIDGAARLELLPGNLVAPLAAGHVADPKRPPAPAAFVSVALLVATLDARVRQVDLRVPVAASTGRLAAGDEVDVAFRVDLRSALHSELPPGEYQIYAAGTRYVAGPYSLVVNAH